MLHRLFPALSIGFLITLTQIALSCLVQPQGLSMESYLRFFNWDSVHYADLVETGYFSTLPPMVGDTDFGPGRFQRQTNAVFFPGYVIAGRIVRAVTGFTLRFSLLLAAALAAWGFWSTLLLLMRKWMYPVTAQAAVLLAIAAHPAAFFLVAGYSESLFLFGLVGFIFWSEFRKVLPTFLAAAHGTVMTATRIFGLPLVVYPVVVAVLERGSIKMTLKKLPWAWVAALGAALGGVLFFTYCSVALGKWDLYILAQQKRWGLAPDPLFPFHSRALFFPVDLHPLRSGNAFSQFMTPVTLWFLLLGIAADVYVRLRRRVADTLGPQRTGLWVLACGSFVMSAATLATVDFRSMTRYSFVPFLLAVLALGSLYGQIRPARWVSVLSAAAFVVALVLSFSIQIFLIRQFTAGVWVS